MKYLILISLFFTSCSTVKKQKNSLLYRIETKMLSNKIIKCSSYIVTEAKSRARITSQNQNKTCDLKINIKNIDGNRFKLNAKHTYINGTLTQKRKMSLKGLLGKKMTFNAGGNDYTFLVEKVQTDTSLL